MLTQSTLEHDLAALLNRHSVENDSNTPDFVMAKFLLSCLRAFNTASVERKNLRAGDADLERTEVQASEVMHNIEKMPCSEQRASLSNLMYALLRRIRKLAYGDESQTRATTFPNHKGD